MNQATVEERARVELERRKEEQKLTKLKKIIEIKLKDFFLSEKDPQI
jgi:hypothetical protein